MKSIASTQWAEKHQSATADIATRRRIPWPVSELERLLELHATGLPVAKIALKLGRTYYSTNVALFRALATKKNST